MQSRKQQTPDGVALPSLGPAAAPTSGPPHPHSKKRAQSSTSPQGPQDLDYLRSAIRVIPDFPKPGVSFKDITPLLRDPVAYNLLIQLMKARVLSICGGVHSMFVCFTKESVYYLALVSQCLQCVHRIPGQPHRRAACLRHEAPPSVFRQRPPPSPPPPQFLL
jgi:hypothetical protein